MGGEWALGRGDTSQERDKLVEVLSASRMVVILGGSEGDKRHNVFHEKLLLLII